MKILKTKNININGAILDKQMMCNYMTKIASEQTTNAYSDKDTFPIYWLKQNYNIIYETYLLLNEHARLKIKIDPAGEWLLDNFYVIEEITKSILKELNLKQYKKLRGISNGRYKGFARAYTIAAQIMAYTDGKVDEESIKAYLTAYQSKRALTMEEIWTFPLFLEIAAIQNIREICEKIYTSQIQKYKAESIIERLVDHKQKSNQNFNKQFKYKRNDYDVMNYSFIEYLSYKLKSYGKKGAVYLQILEEQVNRTGTTVGEIIKQVHFLSAINKVSVGNLITSIKEISHMDFAEISKQIGGIEEILLCDPSGIYGKMDYKTKNDYKNIIQEISRETNISEIYIANTLIQMAKEEIEKNNGDDSTLHKKKTHIGYFLLCDKETLYKRLDVRKLFISEEKKAKLYMAVNIIIPIYLCFLVFVWFYNTSNKFIFSIFASALLFLPLTEIIAQTIIYILSKFIKPRKIPKIDLSNGIPKESATFVVIPTILGNAKKVEEIVEKLEVYYLANKSKNVYFAILGDVTAGQNEEEPFDIEIINAGKELIARLNNKYKVDDELNIFHFLYRKRTWNSKESCYLGWERKRGLLIQFNEFLKDPQKNDFKCNTIAEQIDLIPQIKYVITLDLDTNLVLNSGLELIGAMEHILNIPIIKNGKVVDGHAIMQPRIGVDLISSSNSLFSKIFSVPRGN